MTGADVQSVFRKRRLYFRVFSVSWVLLFIAVMLFIGHELPQNWQHLAVVTSIAFFLIYRWQAFRLWACPVCETPFPLGSRLNPQRSAMVVCQQCGTGFQRK